MRRKFSANHVAEDKKNNIAIIARRLVRKIEESLDFNFEDLGSFDKIVKLMYRPTDAASLGVTRALFGKPKYTIIIK